MWFLKQERICHKQNTLHFPGYFNKATRKLVKCDDFYNILLFCTLVQCVYTVPCVQFDSHNIIKWCICSPNNIQILKYVVYILRVNKYSLN